MNNLRFAGALAAVLFLAACNGGAGTGSQQGSGQAAARSDMTAVETFDLARDDLAGVPNSSFASIPARGTARFDGAAQLRVAGHGNSGTIRRYVGQADITVDFQREGLVGVIDGFERRGSNSAIGGEILITQGVIGVSRPNDFEAEYAGTLRDGGSTVRVNSRLSGDFRGSPIRGMVATDRGSDARLNGRDTEFWFDMYLNRR